MKSQRLNGSWKWVRGVALLTIGMLALANGAVAADSTRRGAETAAAMLSEAKQSALADYWLAYAKSDNLTNSAAMKAFRLQALADLVDAQKFANDQYNARIQAAKALGGRAYDPVIDPTNFVAGVTNPYWTWIPGKTFVYQKVSGTETEVVSVVATTNTKAIMGVTCMVVTDTATIGGVVVEDTLDWYAQDTAGNVWYFGELSKQYANGQLTDLKGSWEAGVDDAKPGIVMEAHPAVGDIYRQEFSLGIGEDISQILGVNQSVTVAYGAYTDCVKTKDYSPIDGGQGIENKYFSATVGQVVLTIDVTTGDREELIQILP
jgi:hypothetical protein